MKNVHVELEGSDHDLVALEGWIAVLGHQVKRDQRYILTSPLFEACANAQEVRDEAVQLIERINATGRFYDWEFEGVDAYAMTYELADGTRRHHAWVQPVNVEMHFAGGVPEPDVVAQQDGAPQPTLIELTLELMEEDRAVNRALQFFRLPYQTWGSLLSIWEIVRHDLNPETKTASVLTAVGVELPDAESFIETANSSSHTGLHARHGRPDTRAMQYPPMTLETAEHLVRRMLKNWIWKKLASKILQRHGT